MSRENNELIDTSLQFTDLEQLPIRFLQTHVQHRGSARDTGQITLRPIVVIDRIVGKIPTVDLN